MNTYLAKATMIAFGLLVSASSIAEEELWKFRLTPYVWLAGFEGSVSPLKGVPPSDVDISASDALSDTESSFMMILDAKKGRHGIYSDVFYSDITSRETIGPATNTRLTSTTETTVITVGYSHTLLVDDGMSIDFLAGARWWHIDAEVEISSLIPALNVAGDNTESWFDPFIGIKGHIPISASNFYVSGGAAYGGFDINADSFYELSANLGYQWTDTIGTAIGYRMYELDYDQNDFQYDVKQSGWQLGLTWGF